MDQYGFQNTYGGQFGSNNNLNKPQQSPKINGYNNNNQGQFQQSNPQKPYNMNVSPNNYENKQNNQQYFQHREKSPGFWQQQSPNQFQQKPVFTQEYQNNLNKFQQNSSNTYNKNYWQQQQQRSQQEQQMNNLQVSMNRQQNTSKSPMHNSNNKKLQRDYSPNQPNFNKQNQNYQGQMGYNSSRQNTSEAEKMYMGYNNNNNRVNTQPQHSSKKSNLDSFSQINNGSILDEGVNSNMPTSKAITASKQPFENQHYPYNNNQIGSSKKFFSNYNNTGQRQEDSNNRNQPNPYIIKDKDTGQVYDIRDYTGDQLDFSKDYPKTKTNNFMNQNKNSKKSSQVHQNHHNNNNNYSNRAHSPYISSKPTTYSQMNQNYKFNNAKSLSPSPNQPSSYQQFSLQNSNNNLSNRSSNVTKTQGSTTQQNLDDSQSNWQQLMSFTSKINKELLLQAKFNNTEKCRDLMDRDRKIRADVNTVGDDSWTPLHYAALNGNPKLVSFFLYHEAVIDAQTKQNVTPLIIAAQRGFDDIFQILMTAGADINHCDINKDTPLHHATFNKNKIIVEMLLRKPSLNHKAKNIQGKEAYDLIPNPEIKRAYDNFYQIKKGMMMTNPRVNISDVQNDTIQRMFNTKPKNVINNRDNSDILSQMKVKGTKNQSTSNSENTTDENSRGSSFNNEEKVGPNSFQVHGLIGKGSFGEVYLVEKKSNSMLYAMKVLHKDKIIKHNLTRYAQTERNVLSLTNHPFIVKMQFAFQTQEKLFLILDYCPGGDLGELLQKEKKFTEERVKIYLCEIVLALEDLHKRDVIFRDLKPDNIVLDHEGHAMLTDFGLSKEGILDPNTGARSFCGSVAYLAPEMLKRCGHGKAVDWYLLGVVMYEFLIGIPPYYANDRQTLFENIEKAPLRLPASLSKPAKNLLKALLQRNPQKRLGSGRGDAQEIKSHEFFEGVNWEQVEARALKPPIPKRKIRISTKFDPNIFDHPTGAMEDENSKIKGWSFVNPNYQSNPYQ